MRVLIVEDDAALGLFLQKGLKLEGHEVDWVGDGVAGLERARRDRPDLIVLDLSLPKKDGTEVLVESRVSQIHSSAVLRLRAALSGLRNGGAIAKDIRGAKDAERVVSRRR
jgi:DNA-binding response OmpR family regulator